MKIFEDAGPSGVALSPGSLIKAGLQLLEMQWPCWVEHRVPGVPRGQPTIDGVQGRKATNPFLW